MSELTICFCTVVKNRLHHLRKTLPVSLLQNQHPQVKFLILDYNSNDGLEEYIKTSFQEEIDTGKLIYYRNNLPEHFNQSHSRNMAFKLADADLVCNVDADNFVGPGFGKYLCEQFSAKDKIYFTGIGNALDVEDVRGKVCVRKSDFLYINGYDESFEGYGYEDYDFVNRLDMQGIKRQVIEEAPFLLALTHPNVQRLSNEKLRNALHSIYVHYIDPDQSEIMLLMKDATAFRGTIVNNFTSKNTDYPYEPVENFKTDFKFFMANGGWNQGYWKEQGDRFKITFDDLPEFYVQVVECGQEILNCNTRLFYKIYKPEMIGEGVMFFMLIRNRERMLHNMKIKNVILNRPFGEGTVYKNFNSLEPLNM